MRASVVILGLALAAGCALAATTSRAQTTSFDDLAARTAAHLGATRLSEALAAAQLMTEQARQRFGDEHAATASALDWLGRAHLELGNLSAAEPAFERALAIARKVHPPGHQAIATGINNYGFLLQSLGRLEEAERHYKQALELRERQASPNVLEISDSLNNIGQIYKRQFKIAEALPILQQSLDMRVKGLGPDDAAIADSLHNLASTYELLGRFAEAEPLLRRALAIRDTSVGRAHTTYARTAAKLAENLYKQERYGDADALFRSAAATMQAANAQSTPAFTNVSVGLAHNSIARGDFREAEGLFREAISASQLPPGHIERGRLLLGLAESLSGQGRDADALQQVQAASAIHIASRSSDDLTRLHFLKHLRLAWRVTKTPTGTATTQHAGETLLIAQHAMRSESGVAIARMSARLAAKDPSLHFQVRQRDEFEAQRASLERQMSAVLAQPREKRAGADDRVREDLNTIETSIARVDTDIRTRFPDYFNLVRAAPLGEDRLRSLLAADEALVAIVSGYDETYVWSVTREGTSWHRVDMTMGQLSSAIVALREALDLQAVAKKIDQGARLFDLALSHHLYSKLLGPLEASLKQKRHLMVVTYGPMTSLPLHLLVTGGPLVIQPVLKDLPAYQKAHWLIRRHAISVLPTIASLDGLRRLGPRKAEGARPMIGFGNPAMSPALPLAAATSGVPAPQQQDTRASAQPALAQFWNGSQASQSELRRLPDLPETEKELRTVAKYLGASAREIYLGRAATETAVKQTDLTPYRVIYFATHGLVAGELKGVAEPALVMSLPNEPTPMDDGLLTASEIAQLKLDADWVVLSACNTAAGAEPGADALSGLAKAFFYAGSRSLLVSNWNVYSDAAAQLTTTMFDRLRAKPDMRRAEALRQAMLDYIDRAKSLADSYPDAWAPFMLVGEGEGMKR